MPPFLTPSVSISFYSHKTGALDEQYRPRTEKVVGQPWLRTIMALGYTYGFRRAELLNMRCGQVDLFAKTFRLNPGETKNRKGRTITLTEECYQPVAQMMRKASR
jgi:integrase